MNSAASGHITDWSDEQRNVIDLPLSAHAMVVADAGTGKTEVMLSRLAELVSLEKVAPGSELLILSFTRSAVGEIRNRLHRVSGRARYTDVRTFDSFSTWILSATTPEDEWVDLGFDGRIEAATACITESAEAMELLSRYRHIFVDEIQDLVGVRAALTMQLLESISGGFTILGDPAQSIYSFHTQSEDTESLFDWVRSRFSDDLIELTLTCNFRAKSDVASRALASGHDLNRPNPNYERIGRSLIELTRGLSSIPTPSPNSRMLSRVRRSTAILSRTNGQALVLSGLLRESRIDHTLRRSASDRAISPWVARVFAGVDSESVGRTRMVELIQGVLGPDGDDYEAKWQLIQRFDPRRRSQVDVERLRARIARGQVPDELTRQFMDLLTVSTIHHAKGLEFDDVVVVQPPDFHLNEDPVVVADETRILYVALTRARKHILKIPAPDVGRMFVDRVTGRWVRRGPRSWQTAGFEVRSNDAHWMDPTGAHALDQHNPLESQDYLWDEVGTGDPLELRFMKASLAGELRVYYRILHHGRPVGITSSEFGRDLDSRLHSGRPRGQWPESITDVYVESVDTVAGARATSRNAGLGSSGLWLRVRLVGLGTMNW